MKDKNEIISFIDNIKNKINENKYHLASDLKEDFFKVKEYIWEDINNLKKCNLSNISFIHSYLVKEVCKIHTMEEDIYNKEILNLSLNIRDIKGQLNDGKRAFDIYTFTDNDYEYYFVGDLHSDTISLKRILKASDFFESIINNKKKRLVFLGDYVDRGSAQIEIMEFILLLKYIFPNNIFLLRGNHDGGSIEDNNIKLCVGREKNSLDDDYFLLYVNNLSIQNNTFKSETVNKYVEFFNSLCNTAIFKFEKINLLAVHGGIPRPKIDLSRCYSYIKTISDLTNENIIDDINRTIRHNMLWSDPREEIEEIDLTRGRFKFHKEHFEEFIDVLGIDLLIRGHEAEKEGLKEYFDSKLFTIFSSGIILNKKDENINVETAYKHVTPKILKLNIEKQLQIIDINNDCYR